MPSNTVRGVRPIQEIALRTIPVSLLLPFGQRAVERRPLVSFVVHFLASPFGPGEESLYVAGSCTGVALPDGPGQHDQTRSVLEPK